MMMIPITVGIACHSVRRRVFAMRWMVDMIFLTSGVRRQDAFEERDACARGQSSAAPVAWLTTTKANINLDARACDCLSAAAVRRRGRTSKADKIMTIVHRPGEIVGWPVFPSPAQFPESPLAKSLKQPLLLGDRKST